MLLVPEQIRNIKETIEKLRIEKEEYKNYFADRKGTNAEETFQSSIGNDMIETQYQAAISKLRVYEKALDTATYIREVSKDTIGIGNKVKILFDGEEESEIYMLADTDIGLDLSTTIITAESPLGKSIMGKQAGESFDYKVENSNLNLYVSGVIEEILPPSTEITFIRNKYLRDRKYKAAKYATKYLEETKDLEESKKELEKWQEITETQKDLLKTELEHLEKTVKTTEIASRKTQIKKLLKHKVSKPEPGIISVGSRFSMMLYGNDQTIFKRVELINQAYSDELNDEYVERISALGMAVYGLKEGEEFTYKTKEGHISGVVYDIDHRLESSKTTSPLVYQKSQKKI